MDICGGVLEVDGERGQGDGEGGGEGEGEGWLQGERREAYLLAAHALEQQLLQHQPRPVRQTDTRTHTLSLFLSLSPPLSLPLSLSCSLALSLPRMHSSSIFCSTGPDPSDTHTSRRDIISSSSSSSPPPNPRTPPHPSTRASLRAYTLAHTHLPPPPPPPPCPQSLTTCLTPHPYHTHLLHLSVIATAPENPGMLRDVRARS